MLYTETIGISAEVINIQVECDKEINFGEVKGRMTHIYNYQILSKIKYNMDCTLDINMLNTYINTQHILFTDLLS